MVKTLFLLYKSLFWKIFLDFQVWSIVDSKPVELGESYLKYYVNFHVCLSIRYPLPLSVTFSVNLPANELGPHVQLDSTRAAGTF